MTRRHATLAIASGLLIWLAFQPGLAPVGAIALVPLLMATSGLEPRPAALVGALAGGLGFSLVGWGFVATASDGLGVAPLTLALVCVGPALSLTVPLCILAVVISRLPTRVTCAWALVAAASFAAADTIYASLWLPYRITQLPACWASWPVAIQTADILGTAGPAFLLGVANLLGFGIIGRRMAPSTAGCLAATLVVGWGYGFLRLEEFAEPESTVLVAYRESLPASGLAPVPSEAVVAILPESTLDLTGSDPNLTTLVDRATRPGHPPILTGARRAVAATGGFEIRNSAVLLTSDGVRYRDKRRLLPFVEQFPLGAFDPLGCSRRGFVNMSPGPRRPALFAVAQQKLSTLICFETLHPDLAAADCRQGARALVVISDETALGRSTLRQRILAQCILRAVENRRALLKVDGSGASTLILASGEVRPLDGKSAGSGWRTVALPWVPSSTAASSTGSVMARPSMPSPSLCVVGCVGPLVLWKRSRKKKEA